MRRDKDERKKEAMASVVGVRAHGGQIACHVLYSLRTP